MEKCIYCQTYRKQKPVSKERNPTRQARPVEYFEASYCSHRHSPLPLELFKQGMFQSNLILECEGIFEKCTIPRHKYSDYDR